MSERVFEDKFRLLIPLPGGVVKYTAASGWHSDLLQASDITDFLTGDHTWTGFHTFQDRTRFDGGLKFTTDTVSVSTNAFSVDFNQSYHQTVSFGGATGNLTCNASSNVGIGKRVHLYVTGDNSADREITWPAGWTWTNGLELTEAKISELYHVVLTATTGADSGVVAEWINPIAPLWKGTETSDTNLTAGGIDMSLTEDLTYAGFFSYSSPDLTIVRDGRYRIRYGTSLHCSSGSNRIPGMYLQRDTGGGYAAVAASYRHTFMSSSTLDLGSVEYSDVLDLDASDTIKWTGYMQNGANNSCNVVADENNLTVEYLGPQT